MAKAAPKRPAKAPAKTASNSRGGMKPVLLAAGLGLYWFVEYQDIGGSPEVPMWGYAATLGVRLLANFVGAWVLVSALQLLLALCRLGFAYARGWMLQRGSERSTAG
jgi:hypothetical protein